MAYFVLKSENLNILDYFWEWSVINASNVYITYIKFVKYYQH